MIIRCDGNEWKPYFDDYMLMDPVSISEGELLGIDYRKRVYYKPDWLKDAERTNILVLTGLNLLPVNSDDPSEKTQVHFSRLIREKSERDEYRELGCGTGIFVLRSLLIFISFHLITHLIHSFSQDVRIC